MKIMLSLVLIVAALPASLGAQDKKKKEGDEPGLEGIKALRNADPVVRFKAANILVRLGPIAKFASAELREAYAEEMEPLVKVKMAEAIWSVDRPLPSILMPFLLEALKDDSKSVRVLATGVLAQMGPRAKGAVPHLIRALNDPETQVRVSAIVALGEMGPVAKSAAEPLLAAIDEKGKDLVIDAMVASALGRLGPDVLPLLNKTLEGKSPRKRLAAVYALGDMGLAAKDSVPALESLLKDKDELANLMVLQALGKIGKPAAGTAAKVEPFLKSENPSTRLEAALTLFLITGKVEQLPIILTLLGDEKTGLTLEATLALKHFGTKAKDAAPELRKRLMDPDFDLRMAAALAFWAVTGDPKESLKVFEATIDNADNAIRRRTLEYLEEMGPAAAPLLPLIQEAARDDDEGVRSQARRVLEKIRM